MICCRETIALLGNKYGSMTNPIYEFRMPKQGQKTNHSEAEDIDVAIVLTQVNKLS